VDKDDLQYEITLLEEKLALVKPNLAAIDEYRKKEEEYLKRVADLDAITEERDGVRGLFEVSERGNARACLCRTLTLLFVGLWMCTRQRQLPRMPS